MWRMSGIVAQVEACPYNYVISDVRQHVSLTNLCNQRVERVLNTCASLTVEPPHGQSTGKLRRNPHDNVVRVGIDAHNKKTLRLNL
jgi:hypothetical protein